MLLALDASNLRAGGGLVHVRELLARGDPADAGFRRTVVWAGSETAGTLRRSGAMVEARTPAALDGPLPVRAAWQRWRLPARAAAEDADLLFSPGGTAPPGAGMPVVTVFQNMLPFAPRERARYGWSWMRLRLAALARLQRRSFAASDGVVCLTDHARRVLEEAVPEVRGRVAVIPHGVDGRFFRVPERGPPGDATDRPVRILYLSVVDVYKHQPEVAEAARLLRDEGCDARLDLVGPAYGPALQRLERTLDRVDPEREVVRYRGPVDHDRVHAAYAEADIFVFASTCENLPIVLLEAMASGLPVACSDRPPMPDVLGDAGVYFDPEDPTSIAGAVAGLLDDPGRARRLGERARERARAYSWERCARETFEFLASVAG